MTAAQTIEIVILELLADTYGEPGHGHQEQAQADAVARLVALARQHQAARNLLRYAASAESFKRAVDRSGSRG